ncbi:hypothetical protein BC938DRAFT_474813 [Jimgerdemannia flammicorona]|uniref:Ser-Thr-rich glycosyl-phosphatidyl-inositol-anchored membrane family-domain-containing protein n=1 Tax=Jimgerdemannia flammicorona TaxID=994334 RepID=A0A433QZF6_9FUNG|nr:hypothetical protein BC938DRAFT_474813 [Jimgerdemannia flammicorona]
MKPINNVVISMLILTLAVPAVFSFQDSNYDVASPLPNSTYPIGSNVSIVYELLPTLNTFVANLSIFLVQPSNQPNKVNLTITNSADLTASGSRNGTRGQPFWEIIWSVPASLSTGSYQLEFNSVEVAEGTFVQSFVVNTIPISIADASPNTTAPSTSLKTPSISASSTDQQAKPTSAAAATATSMARLEVLVLALGALGICTFGWI